MLFGVNTWIQYKQDFCFWATKVLRVGPKLLVYCTHSSTAQTYRPAIFICLGHIERVQEGGELKMQAQEYFVQLAPHTTKLILWFWNKETFSSLWNMYF